MFARLTMRPRQTPIASALTVASVCFLGAGVSSASLTPPCVAGPGLSDRCPQWLQVGGGAPAGQAVSPDGKLVFVVSSSFDGIATTAYDVASGDPAWSASYQGPARNQDMPAGVIVSPDGQRVVTTGWSDGIGTHADVATMSYDAATGTPLWTARYDGPEHLSDRAVSIAMGPSRVPDVPGQVVYVTGWTGDGSRPDYLTIAYSLTTGEQLWTARYAGPADEIDTATAVQVTPDGERVIVTGASDGAKPTTGEHPSDFLTVAYDASSGKELWEARHDGDGHGYDGAVALAVSPVGDRVAVTGPSLSAAGDVTYETVAHDSRTGERLWEMRYRGVQGPAPATFVVLDPNSPRNGLRVANGGDEPHALAFSPDGSRLYVTGTARNFPHGDAFLTVAYDAATGAQRWAMPYDGPQSRFDSATALAVSADGSRIYVTGASGRNGLEGGGVPWEARTLGLDIATVAYDADGAARWVGRVDVWDQSEDQALSIQLRGNRAFIIGVSQWQRVEQGFARGYGGVVAVYDITEAGGR